MRVSPGGAKSFFVQYRTGEGRRTDRNRKLTLGRYPELSPGAARKQAQALLGRARDGRDPSRERTLARGLPRVGDAVEAWLGTRNVADTSLQLYRRSAEVWLKGWLGRRLDEVSREDAHERVRSESSSARRGQWSRLGIIQSLMVTCRLHGADPYTYLVDVLQRISEHPAKRVRELTPRMWKSLFAHDPLPSALGHHLHDPPSH